MELFKSKESFNEKVDSNTNWKTAWPRMILEWHLFLRLSLGFVWKMLIFARKHQSFYPKDVSVCSFSVFFYLNEKALNQQVCLIKYAENEISNSTSHKKEREREEQKHIQLHIQLQKHWKIVIIYTSSNFYKLSCLPLVVRPWRKFEKDKLVLNFESCYCYFK